MNPILVNGRPVAVDACLSIAPSRVPAPRHLIINLVSNTNMKVIFCCDGTPVLLRPIKPEDEALAYRLLQSLARTDHILSIFSPDKKFDASILSFVLLRII